MKGNGFITWMLRSPLHGVLSGSTMLITVTGCKTGREITTPVNYAQENNKIWVTSFVERRWWRNLRGGQPVKLNVRGEERQGWGRAIEDREEVEQLLSKYLQKLPRSAKYFDVTIDEKGLPDPQEIAIAARSRVMVEIKTP